ncbi:unnamed protein product, partial [Prorocentrum cordatum]
PYDSADGASSIPLSTLILTTPTLNLPAAGRDGGRSPRAGRAARAAAAVRGPGRGVQRRGDWFWRNPAPAAPVDACLTAREGDRCHKAVKYAVEKGLEIILKTGNLHKYRHPDLQ